MIILVFALYLSFIIYIAIGLLRLPKEKPLADCNEKVTVVMAVKNEAKSIKNCLDDFLNQTYKNVEFIIINDNRQITFLIFACFTYIRNYMFSLFIF